jgi:hypothetical protein
LARVRREPKIPSVAEIGNTPSSENTSTQHTVKIHLLSTKKNPLAVKVAYGTAGLVDPLGTKARAVDD